MRTLDHFPKILMRQGKRPLVNARLSLRLGLVLLMTGCIAIPQDVPVPQPQGAQKVSGIAWWKALKDPLIDQWVDQLMVQNLDLKMAESRTQKAKAMLEQAWGGALPEINATGQGMRGKNQIFLKKPISNAQGGVALSWNLDLFGRARAALRAERARLLASVFAAEDARHALRGQLINAIVSWRAQRIKRLALIDQVRAYDLQVDLYTRQVEAGLADARVKEQAVAVQAQARSDLAIADSTLKGLQYDIELLLGQAPGTLTSALASVPEGPLTMPSLSTLEGIPMATLRQRPDVQEARALMLAAAHDLEEAEAALWPQISVGAFFGAQTVSQNVVTAAANPIWSLTSNVLFPLLNFGKLRGAIHGAEASRRKAALAYEKVVMTALNQAHTALVSHLEGLRALAHQTTLVNSCASSLALEKARFEGGLENRLPLIAAEVRLAQARASLAGVQARTVIAYVDLQRTLASGAL